MIAARSSPLAVAVVLWIAGCTATETNGMPPPAIGGTDDTGSSGDPPPISTAPPGPTDPSDDDGGSSTGLGGLDSGDDTVFEIGGGGGGMVVPGTSWTQVWGEAFVLQYDDGVETILCVIAWEATMSEVLTSCADCEFAFAIENGAPEVEVDEDGACGQYGLDADAIAGQRVEIGYRASEMLQTFDDAWVSLGDAEFDPATGDFYYEWADEP